MAMKKKVIRVGVAGCGNVSRWSYLPHLSRSRFVELVAVADPDRRAAGEAAKAFRVPHVFTDPRAMLREVPFDLFVNLSPMPQHGSLNLAALLAGRHVWCEKPFASSPAYGSMLLREARRRHRTLLAAPFTTASPAFLEIRRLIRTGRLGKVCQIRGRYGHGGQLWSSWFFRKGGGSLFDLGVYNVTTLTGWMGPAVSVSAVSGIAVPVRRLTTGARVRAEVEDNMILTLDFGQARFGVIQCGFTIEKVDGGGGHVGDAGTSSIEVVGTGGTARMLGYDWAPSGVQVGLKGSKTWTVTARNQKGYAWQGGATHMAECLATGRKPLVSGSHALHVLEILDAAHRSAKTGLRVKICSTFTKSRD